MALAKRLKASGGKLVEVAATDTVEQVGDARIYTPTGSGVLRQHLFNEASGTTFADDLGNESLTANEGVTIAAGDTGFGNAITSTGDTSMTVSEANRPTIFPQPNTDYAMHMRFKPPASGYDSFSWIFRCDGGAVGRVRFYYLSNTSVVFDVFSEDSGTVFEQRIAADGSDSSAPDMLDDTWHDVHIMLDDSAGTWAFYIDNIDVTGEGTIISGSNTGHGYSTAQTGTIDCFVGGISTTAAFPGQIDALQIWQKVLTASERTATISTEDQTTSIVDGDVAYLNTSGEIDAADASDSLKWQALGFYEDTDDSVTAKVGSEITGFNVETAITMAAGDVAYLSSSEAGKITNVAPTASGSAVVRLGRMESATKLILDIEFQLVN